MYLVAAAINTNGDTLDIPSMQPTEHPRTSPPGLRVAEHMPRRPSCVCLSECYFSRANATCLLYTSPSPRDKRQSRMPSSAAAASYSKEQRAAACGVRHNVQTGIKWSGNKITISCQSEHRNVPPHLKHPRLKKHFFRSRNPMYRVAAAINTNCNISGMPSLQPTEHPRTSPPGLRVSEHMPRRPSCVCLPECSFSRANATGALKA